MVCRRTCMSFCTVVPSPTNDWCGFTVFLVSPGDGYDSPYSVCCIRGDAEYLAVHRSVTFFTEPRIIYGVTGVHSSLKLPYPAHRRAAFAEVSLFSVRSPGLRSCTVCCFVRVLLDRSSASLRSRGAKARRLVRTGPSSASRLFGCQWTVEEALSSSHLYRGR